MIDHIEPLGLLVHECSVPGETRADDVYPAHPNGLQLARDRFAIVYATRGWRGIDDDRSIILQVRRDGYNGSVLREHRLQVANDDWRPLAGGERCVKQHGSPVAFGVPYGVNGLPHAGLFVVKWRRVARVLDEKTGFLIKFTNVHERVDPPTQAVEWMQFRWDPAADDIRVTQPPTLLKQNGYEHGYAFCEHRVWHMNQSFVQPVPYTQDGSEWIDCNSFDDGSLACHRYRYDPATDRYDWVQTGPRIVGLRYEAAVAAWNNRWLLCARPYWKDRGSDAVYMAVADDPMNAPVEMTVAPDVHSGIPRTCYRGADGAIRLLTTDRSVSGARPRDPLLMWRVHPDKGFTTSDRRVVFDADAAGVPYRDGCPRCVDMAKLLPHAGGKTQVLLFRVRPGYTNNPADHGEAVNDTEKVASGIYAARIHYTEAHRPAWDVT